MKSRLTGKSLQVSGALTAKVYDILGRRYGETEFWQLPPGERLLLVASVLVNDLKVREKTANNSPYLEEMREVVQATKNDAGAVAWCGVFITYCGFVADVEVAKKMATRGFAVRYWADHAIKNGRKRTKPTRGDLCLFLNADKTGHIGVVAGIQTDGKIISYEGNTSAGVSGSQRDGDGAYRRVRSKSTWDMYVDVD